MSPRLPLSAHHRAGAAPMYPSGSNAQIFIGPQGSERDSVGYRGRTGSRFQKQVIQHPNRAIEQCS
jgi:hypothetical protein